MTTTSITPPDSSAAPTPPGPPTSPGIIGLMAVVGALAAVALGLAIASFFTGDGDGGSVSTGASTAITATLSEFAIDVPAQVPTGDVEITVNNGGSLVHNLALRETGAKTPDLNAGASAVLSLPGLQEGTYELYCTIQGHAESGMSTTLTVSEGGVTTPASDHADLSEADATLRNQVMIDSILEFPAATEGLGNQVLEPEILADGTKHFELTAAITPWEVEPGRIVDAWTYNGMVPGPRINVDVGDQVEVQITNNLPLGTDIHWHGIDVPNAQDGVSPLTQDMILTGETYTYEFTVTEAAIGMFHAHAHAQEAVPNGMFGTIYVGEIQMPVGQTISGIEVPQDLELAVDIPMVLNDAGVIGFSLNGKSFPATAPIVAQLGDWIRVTYFNEGLQVHPMHLHGMEQLVVAKDGEFLDYPYAADTVLVAPGERYTVLVRAAEPGAWVWHCHILNHVESEDGVFGMLTALIIE